MCHGPPPGGGASRRGAKVSWWSSSWPTPYGGLVVLVCVVVRKGCVSILTRRVIFGELLWVKQVWEVFCFFFSFSRERRAGIRHSGIWSELGCPLVWVAEVNR